jgi:ketosteroid isomerase-like protein
MQTWPREELEQAFRTYFMIGPVEEDWEAWSRLFTDDAVYFGDFWGTFRGPAEIQLFLEGTMSAGAHVYSVLTWYRVADDRVIYEVLNRADHPTEGGAPIDFPSLTVITYAGDGRWSSEHDWWVMRDMVRHRNEFLAACAEAGIDPEQQRRRLSRRDWGPWVDWARPKPGHETSPSWLRTGATPIAHVREMTFGERPPPA